jgi:ABC-2 type transport system permease protein
MRKPAKNNVADTICSVIKETIMKALLYKDFLVLKKSLLLLALLVVAIGIFSYYQGAILILPLIFMLIPVILLGLLFSYDTKSDADQDMSSDPINRRTIVWSRYVFVWIIAIVGTLFALLLKLIMKDALSDIPWFLIVPAMLLLVTFLSSIQLPLIYKFGAEEVKGIFVFIYFVVFALFFYLGGNEDLFSEFLDNLTHLNLRIVSLVLAGITILLNGVSLVISSAIYERGE